MDAEGIEYKKVDMTPEIKEELKQMTGKGSAPSVWIKGTYVGGCNDGTESWHGVKPMLKNGKFQEMLSGNAVFLCAPTAQASSAPATVRYSTSPGSEDSTGGMGVEALIKSADVVAFHLETCPFCRKTFAAMDAEGIEYKKVDMTPEIKEELKQMTGKGSAPSVWIKGTYVGGCNDGTESWHGVKPMLKNGKFQEMLSGNAVFLTAPTAPASSHPATVRYASEDSTGGMGVEALIKSADVVAFHLETC